MFLLRMQFNDADIHSTHTMEKRDLEKLTVAKLIKKLPLFIDL
jgi:hypothetical protein